MKRTLCGMIAVVIMVGLVGCAEADSTFSDSKLNFRNTLYDITYAVDSSWGTEEDAGYKYYLPFESKSDGFILVCSSEMNEDINIGTVDELVIEQSLLGIANGFYGTGNYTVSKSDSKKILNYPCGQMLGTFKINEKNYGFDVRLIITAQRVYAFYAIQANSVSKNFTKIFDLMFANIEIEESASKMREAINGFEPAYFDVYNSYSSENKRAGDFIYADGIITEIIEENNTCYIVLEQSPQRKWLITVGNFPDYTFDNIGGIKGQKSRVFFEYVSYSDVYAMPTGYLFTGGKIESMDSESVYSSEYTSDEFYSTWVKENGEKATYEGIKNGKHTGKYVHLTGLVENENRLELLGELNFQMYERDGESYSLCYFSSSINSNFSDRISRNAFVELYGYVDFDNKLNIHSVLTVKPEFTIKDVIRGYKIGCFRYDYDALARNPASYVGAKITFTGEVIQVLELESSTVLRVNVTKKGYGYTDTMYVEYTKGENAGRVLEGDVVTIWGTFGGLKTYDSVLSSSVTIPSMRAAYIEVSG